MHHGIVNLPWSILLCNFRFPIISPSYQALIQPMQRHRIVLQHVAYINYSWHYITYLIDSRRLCNWHYITYLIDSRNVSAINTVISLLAIRYMQFRRVGRR